MKKIKKYSYVRITWIDSTHDSGWRREKEIDDDGYIEYETVGILLDSSKRCYKVVQSKCLGTDQEDNYLVDNIMQIPKVSVINIRKLK